MSSKITQHNRSVISGKNNMSCYLFFLLATTVGFQGVVSVSWEDWWTYDGISGPSFWGLINPDWNLCNHGRRQSPVDIKPQKLLYDPGLRDLKITDIKTDGLLQNSGHGILYRLDTSLNQMVNISGGPVDYNYPIHAVSIHFGLEDESGSEHMIDGRRFPGEIQLLGYNADLYENYSMASREPNGLVAVSVFMEIGDLSNRQIRKITDELSQIQYGGQQRRLRDLSLLGFLPEAASATGSSAGSSTGSSSFGSFLTYEGSMTEPGCQETITWIILNRPVYITEKQLFSLRKLMQGEKNDPRAPLGGNFRPIQPLHGRAIRTNVMVAPEEQEKKCPTLHTNMEYRARRPATNSGQTVK